MGLEIYRGNALVLVVKFDKEYYNKGRIIKLY